MEERLILAVANNPLPYAQSLYSYRDTNQRNHASREVAEAVGGAGINLSGGVSMAFTFSHLA